MSKDAHFQQYVLVPPEGAKAMDDDDHPGLAKVKEMWERGEFEAIDEMVRFWEAMKNIGRVGDLLRRFLIWCGIIAASYFAFTEWFLAYIKKAPGQ